MTSVSPSHLHTPLGALPPDQQVFLGCLAVFPTTFDIGSAAAVSDTDPVDAELRIAHLMDAAAVSIASESPRGRLYLVSPSMKSLIVENTVGVEAMPGARRRHADYFLRDFGKRESPTGPREAIDRGHVEFKRANLELAAMNQIVAMLGDEEAPELPVCPSSALTQRQWEVAQLVAAGRTNYQIAHALGIAEWTAVNHVRSVMRRLGCVSRVEIANVVRSWNVTGRGATSGSQGLGFEGRRTSNISTGGEMTICCQRGAQTPMSRS